MVEDNKYIFFWSHEEKGNDITKACLSQWYPSYMVIDSYHYQNVEQYLMAEKARTFGDEETLGKIWKTSDPKEVKKLGRSVKGYVDDIWVARRKDVALKANTEKFQTIPYLRKFLYETRDSILVEASPYDNVWGIGWAEDKAPMVPEERWGQNLLGQVLMEVRAHLKDPYLKYCRYYDGVDYKNAGAEKELLASYEEAWVRMQIAEVDHIQSMLNEYVAYGQEFFNMDDGVPISIKALLWNRYMHWGGNPNDLYGFRSWYKREYLGEEFHE